MSSENATERKRGYTTPVLTEYGAVQDLTAGGSGVTAELQVSNPAECVVQNKQKIISPFC